MSLRPTYSGKKLVPWLGVGCLVFSLVALIATMLAGELLGRLMGID